MIELKEVHPEIKIDIDGVKKLAKLARIELSDEEEKKFQGEIGSILEYVDQLKECPSLGHLVSKLDNNNASLREDTGAHDPGVYTKDLISEVPNKKDNFIKVKKILEKK